MTGRAGPGARGCRGWDTEAGWSVPAALARARLAAGRGAAAALLCACLGGGAWAKGEAGRPRPKSDDPVVQSLADTMDDASRSDDVRVSAARDLAAAEASRDKEPGAAAAVDLLRGQRDKTSGRGAAAYARQRADLVDAVGTLALQVGAKASAEARRLPHQVGDCLNALLDIVRNPGEPMEARRKAAEKLAEFAETAPQAVVAGSRRILDGAAGVMEDMTEVELAGGWLWNTNPHRSHFKDRKSAIKSALDRLPPLQVPPAQ